MNRVKTAIVTVGTALTAGVVSATPADPFAEITSAVSSVDTIWGTISVIILGVAAVMVGRKFLRKLG